MEKKQLQKQASKKKHKNRKFKITLNMHWQLEEKKTNFRFCLFVSLVKKKTESQNQNDGIWEQIYQQNTKMCKLVVRVLLILLLFFPIHLVWFFFHSFIGKMDE